MNVDDSEKIIYLPPNPVVIYESRPISVLPNQLYVPRSRNQVGFDSFFLLDSFLYFFKLTVADSHDIKTRIKDLLSGYEDLLPPKKNWRFVLITPPDCNIDIKATSEVETFLEGMIMYSAHLQVKQ